MIQQLRTFMRRNYHESYNPLQCREHYRYLARWQFFMIQLKVDCVYYELKKES